jgi:hypothetical protein
LLFNYFFGGETKPFETKLLDLTFDDDNDDELYKFLFIEEFVALLCLFYLSPCEAWLAF